MSAPFCALLFTTATAWLSLSCLFDFDRFTIWFDSDESPAGLFCADIVIARPARKRLVGETNRQQRRRAIGCKEDLLQC